MMNEIMIDKNVNIHINDVLNYNNFYYEYIMNNKNIYNNGKNDKKIKTNIQNIPKIKMIIENDCNKNELNENQLNEEELDKELKENDLNEELNKEELKDRLLYICHNCIKYNTSNRKDLAIHFNRKHKCKNYNTEKEYEDLKILSLNKKFYFYFNIKDILITDFDFINKNYKKKENHIYKN